MTVTAPGAVEPTPVAGRTFRALSRVWATRGVRLPAECTSGEQSPSTRPHPREGRCIPNV
ncbi:hypothetical protein SGL43_04823 [Streptomyces globisporus]|uniref:Uncharacterized protein n=1 Tax=Streptomyces globisporus TaxID=1908 RepID=A0ABM9H2C8_STRGL|nr:hypothetical protein SGL43_04823 [Streptomyces globisporus]